MNSAAARARARPGTLAGTSAERVPLSPRCGRSLLSWFDANTMQFSAGSNCNSQESRINASGLAGYRCVTALRRAGARGIRCFFSANLRARAERHPIECARDWALTKESYRRRIAKGCDPGQYTKSRIPPAIKSHSAVRGTYHLFLIFNGGMPSH